MVTADLERDRIKSAVMKYRGLTLGEIVEKVSKELNVKDYEVAKVIYKMVEDGEIRLVNPNDGFLNFLFYHSIWFFLVLIIVFGTIISVFLNFLPLRYFFGLIFVMYLPGASLTELVYPKKEDLSQLGRLAMGIGLSLALDPIVGLFLNYVPGIFVNTSLISLTLLTLAFSIGALFRKYSNYRLLKEVEKVEK
ncbi:DUF1616 domain-containing protein [Saccharolobus islandicus]|uniref:Membrane protein-like protein n=1 Tax=Saccharolobus islandicus (strain L.D.8.5 / Lassen \|nr:DUF1616 domain-containing protein [Sulfolobus islandicus]ADB86790.1 membrane protein-like protein [Sulfolobus islandicus L.D.8.5]